MKLLKRLSVWDGQTFVFDQEYLTHCDNIARILASDFTLTCAFERIRHYCEITGAELERTSTDLW